MITTTTTTVYIENTTANAEIQTETEIATKTQSGFHVSKIIIIISTVVVMCALAIVILLVARRLNCSKPSPRDYRDLPEEIPLTSTLDPSTLPFIQTNTEL